MLGLYAAVIYFLVFIIIAQLLTPAEYTMRINTVSELAAQNYKNRKVMQIGFVGFGILLSGAIIFKLLINKANVLRSIPIIFYGLSVAMSGLFCTQPFQEGIEYSLSESKIHSLFAQLAGFSFTIGIMICLFQTEIIKYKIIHGVSFVFVMLCSALFGLVPRYRGIFQRIMYLGSFLWLLFFSML